MSNNSYNGKISSAEKNNQTINNLPKRPAYFVKRTREIMLLTDFLKSDDKPNYPNILVLSGIKGCGKTTLVNEITHRYKDANKFKLILWCSDCTTKKLIDLMIKYRPKTPISQVDRERLETKQKLLDVQHKNLNALELKRSKFGSLNVPLELVHEIDDAKQQIEQLEKELNYSIAPKNEDSNCFEWLEQYKPFLLIIDEFDSTSVDIQQTCTKLEEKIHPPNKIIVIERINSHKYTFSQQAKKEEIGCLNQEETSQLVKERLKHIPVRQWDKFGNLDKAAEWVWEVSNGLPHFVIECLIPTVEKEGLSLSKLHSHKWISFFNDYAKDYLTKEIFSSLRDIDIYILLNLIERDIEEQKSCQLEEDNLLESIGVVSEHDHVIVFRKALKNLQYYGFIGFVASTKATNIKFSPTIEYFLLPFVRDLTEQRLESKTIQCHYRFRVLTWRHFFEHHLKNNDAKKLKPHTNKALILLEICENNEWWQLAIDFGTVLIKAMEENGYASDAIRYEHLQDYHKACKRISNSAQKLAAYLIKDRCIYNIEIKYYLKTFISINPISITEAKYLYNRIKKFNLRNIRINNELKSDVTYYYAKALFQTGDMRTSLDPLNEVIQSYSTQKIWEKVCRARLDLAELYLHSNNNEQAKRQVQKVLSVIEKEKPSSWLQWQIKAKSILAQIAFEDKQIEKSYQYIIEVLNNATDKDNQALMKILYTTKTALEAIKDGLDLVTNVDPLLSQSTLTITTDTKCAYCNSKIHRKELFKDETPLYLCQCGDYYHKECIKTYGEHGCKSCHAPYS